MGRKRKAVQNTGKEKPLHPDAWPLAMLTALIDPEGVRQSELTPGLPKSFHTALHLLWKIDDYLNGRLDRLYSLTERKWGPLLNEGKQFSLKEATTQRWCEKYKTVLNLKKFLKLNGYPFGRFDGPLFITEAAYKKALEDDQERSRQLDRERKRRRKRKIVTGKSRQTSGTNHRISASLPEQNGVLPEN